MDVYGYCPEGGGWATRRVTHGPLTLMFRTKRECCPAWLAVAASADIALLLRDMAPRVGAITKPYLELGKLHEQIIKLKYERELPLRRFVHLSAPWGDAAVRAEPHFSRAYSYSAVDELADALLAVAQN